MRHYVLKNILPSTEKKKNKKKTSEMISNRQENRVPGRATEENKYRMSGTERKLYYKG